MSYLMYCLFQHVEEPKLDGVAGVQGQPVAILSSKGLSAVISMVSVPQLPPADLASIRAYQSVIEHFHRERTIIPMRYGCLFSAETQIICFLEDHSNGYHALLEELEGCVEMGIRLLLNHSACEDRAPSTGCPDRVPPLPGFAATGRGYLSARRSHYADRDQLAHAETAMLETVRAPFAGLFVRCKAEKPMSRMGNQQPSPRMLSLYFLVKREEVGKFRQAFQEFAPGCSTRVLLSGPWPPFNFVVPDAS